MKTESSPWWRHLIGYIRQTLKGHPLACLSLGLTLVFATLSIGVLVQRLSAADAPNPLEAALALYQEGEARQAQPLFAAIDPSDPAYGNAQAYDALCRYEVCRADGTNSYRWFLDVVESPALKQAVLPAELREDLAFKQIDAQYQSRQFGSPEILPLLAAFQQEYPASAQLAALGEYDLAARFQRGMLCVYQASWDAHRHFPKAWTNGLASLEQFLSRVGTFPANDYAVLRDRSLAEDLQLALAVLGEAPAALPEIPIRDAVNRQRYGLMRVGLHQKLHPEAWEQNLQMLAEFRAQLEALPASHDRARLQRHLASFGFHTGERLCAEAAGTPPGEVPTAAAKRAAASRYFQTARAVERQVVAAEAPRPRPTDLALLLWVASLNSYCCEQDYASLTAATAAQLTNAVPGEPTWLAAKLHYGVALNHQTPPQPGAAAAAFDEVMAYGFKGAEQGAIHDHLVLVAARWRIQVALKAGDWVAALKVVQWVEQGNGQAQLKAKFLEDHAWVAAWAATKRG